MYDLLVIGGGPGGYTSAIRAAQMGMKVGLIESDKIGGTCLHRGCIPTKVLLHSAYLYSIMKKADLYGISIENIHINFPGIQRRKEYVVKKLYEGLSRLVKKNKIEYTDGTARLTRDKVIIVARNGSPVQEVEAYNIIVAAGSKPFVPDGITVDGRTVITSDHALLLEKLPCSIVICGSGPIGCEFTFFFNILGVDVTLIEAKERILPNEDRDVSLYMERILKKMGVTVLTSASLSSAYLSGSGMTAELIKGEEIKKIKASVLLLAIGRIPNTEALDLAEAGISLSGHFVKTDEHYKTDRDGVYAVGDIRGPVCLAHAAAAQGIHAVNHMSGCGSSYPAAMGYMPNVIYSFPQVASIGLTEEAAVAKGYNVNTGRFPFSANGKAVLTGETNGFVKVVSNAKTDQILGVHIVGHEASEIIGEIPFALRLKEPWSALSSIIHPHPTMSEAIKEAFDSVGGKAIHI